jgi:hypothetical protein
MCLYGQHGDLTTGFHPTTETASMYVAGASCDYLFTIPLTYFRFSGGDCNEAFANEFIMNLINLLLTLLSFWQSLVGLT